MSVSAEQLRSGELSRTAASAVGEAIRVTGIVQGVGFRPTTWRLANELSLKGYVYNDSQGVVIHVWASSDTINHFIHALKENTPPLARIDNIQRATLSIDEAPDGFTIRTSESNSVQTNVTPDAAVCVECLTDIFNPLDRRYRYPMTNCTHCGPRFSIIESIPYDRANTSMKTFEQCGECLTEYKSPHDRRFHAQPNACYTCGPKVEFERIDNNALCMESITQMDSVDGACTVLQNGGIVAVKGIGGFHLACDATNDSAVQRLRNTKQRNVKSFALMARDIAVVRRYARITAQEEILLSSVEAPIVILSKTDQVPPGTKRAFGAKEGERANDLIPISDIVAPGLNTLGFMLPYTPMHHLMLRRMNRPIVLTSANLSDEPQIIHNDDIKDRLDTIADYVLWHDRDIVNRTDDSLIRIVGNQARLLRRSRGYAPAPIPLPQGFDNVPELLAMGGELKNTFCLLKNGQAILSQHMGDLENAAAYADYQKNLTLYADLFQHSPKHIVVDAHPEYLSSKLGRQRAEDDGLDCHVVQHHHAHIAACLAENGYPLDAEPVLGVALDGLGYGTDNTIWGGEFLIANYLSSERVGTFKPVRMLGGSMAMREPWRNTYAHLISETSWPQLKMDFNELNLIQFFEGKPLDTFNAMLAKGTNAPLASSCGRLFDAVAAAMGICREAAVYEGQAAIELEAIVDQDTLHNEDELLAYPFSIPRLDNKLPYVEPLGMWQAILGDLILDTPKPVMSARFHKGLANIIVTMIKKLTTQYEERFIHTVALSGGVFQNKTLFELVLSKLEKDNFNVLTHQQVPANDGGIALGQAVIAAARIIKINRSSSCV
ncbi:MAG: carbamoyltransferase HypF [Pseudomonadales bacterium]|nr:carbamoyltransferase HypF [Pseudomonadales bacterium]